MKKAREVRAYFLLIPSKKTKPIPIEVTFDGLDKSQVEKEINEICQKLLANPVMENFEYEIEEWLWKLR